MQATPRRFFGMRDRSIIHQVMSKTPRPDGYHEVTLGYGFLKKEPNTPRKGKLTVAKKELARKTVSLNGHTSSYFIPDSLVKKMRIGENLKRIPEEAIRNISHNVLSVRSASGQHKIILAPDEVPAGRKIMITSASPFPETIKQGKIISPQDILKLKTSKK